MQEELEQKSVAISIKAGKLTANLLKRLLWHWRFLPLLCCEF